MKQYSGGMRRRLDIAASIVITPDLPFLDEPTTGLDPRTRNQVWELVREIIADGTTVLLTTQYLDEADQLADRIAVIDGGKVIAEGTKGVFDRFRSLPIWRPALMVGALLGDLGRYLVASAIVIALGLVMGFRPDGGVGGVLAAVALILGFAFGLSWIWITLGLVLRTPSALSNFALLIMFPLSLASNIFVDPGTMPGWLRASSASTRSATW